MALESHLTCSVHTYTSNLLKTILLLQEAYLCRAPMSEVRRTMDVIVVWAWMPWESDSANHGSYYGSGMDVLGTGAVEH